ncbi:MAG: DedA family protein [Thermomicrobiales bacterium]|nr:DedA family protein [Thermomicrobiales bacterium]
MPFDFATLTLLNTSATDLTQEGGLIGLVARIIDALGYPGIMLLIAAENIIPPIPSEAILPMAGFLSASGTFHFWLVVLFATLGSLIGATALYYAGLILGRTKILLLIEKHGGKVGLSLDDVKKAERWFQQRGKISVLVGRLVPIVRSLISIPAGFYGMSFPVFLLYSAIGSLIWNTILVGAGYRLESHWDRVEPYVEILQYAVIAAVIIIGLRFLYVRRDLILSRTTTPSEE